MSKRYALALGAGVALIAAIAAGAFRPDRAARVAAGMAAHNLCSATFVAGLDPGATFRELIGAFLQGPAGRRRLLDQRRTQPDCRAAGRPRLSQGRLLFERRPRPAHIHRAVRASRRGALRLFQAARLRHRRRSRPCRYGGPDFILATLILRPLRRPNSRIPFLREGRAGPVGPMMAEPNI
jgi:hypothetical protein